MLLREFLKEEIKPSKLVIYDFDDTLFKSPHPQNGYSNLNWWNNIASLMPPFVPIVPTAIYWNMNIVNNMVADLNNPQTLTVVLTGRGHEIFFKRIRDILASLKLYPKYLLLSPTNNLNTVTNKINTMKKLLNKHPTINEVVLYDDREDYLKEYKKFFNSVGIKSQIIHVSG